MYPTCPCCHAKLLYGEIRYDGPFTCPNCNQSLVVLPVYVMGHFWGALCLSAAILFLCGLRWLALLGGAILVWFPVIALDMFFIRTLFPTPIRVNREHDQKNLTLNLKP
jgi:hypothetical protein